MTDPISNLLAAIKNAIMAKKKEVIVPASKLKLGILEVMKNAGFIKNIKTIRIKNHNFLKITLIFKDDLSIIQGLKRISRPGQRIYVGYRDVKPVLRGFGIAIISTPNGLLTDKEARSKKIGGELICKVW